MVMLGFTRGIYISMWGDSWCPVASIEQQLLDSWIPNWQKRAVLAGSPCHHNKNWMLRFDILQVSQKMLASINTFWDVITITITIYILLHITTYYYILLHITTYYAIIISMLSPFGAFLALKPHENHLSAISCDLWMMIWRESIKNSLPGL